MGLKIHQVYRAVQAVDEWVSFEVEGEAQVNLKDYLFAIVPFDKDIDSMTEFPNCYRFPSCVIEKDDNVVLHTRTGKNVIQKNVQGKTYRFYRNSKMKFYNNLGDRLILFNVSIVNSYTIPKVI